MYRRIILIAAITAALLTACTLPRLRAISGSGRIASQDYAITGFDKIEVHNAFDATVRQGDAFAVSVATDDNLLPFVVVEKVGDTLVIRFDTRDYTSFRSTRQEAAITLPQLESIKASGASTMRLVGVDSTSPFSADLSGASRLTGVLDAAGLRLDASGASNANLSGTIPAVDLSLSGASTADLSNVSAQTLTARLSGGSSATVNASETLDYDLSGAATLRYLGQPSIGKQSTSGGARAMALP